MTLTEFLLARIAEDEADANLCIHPYGEGVTPPTIYKRHEGWPQGRAWYGDGWSSDEAPHLSRWSPARVLAESEAKRQIVEGAQVVRDNDARSARLAKASERTLRQLATIYADHSDYREEWTP